MGTHALHELEAESQESVAGGVLRGAPGARSSVSRAVVAGLPDGELVERVRRGDSLAFDALVRRHDQRAFALAYRVLGHREDAEDVVQEAFLAALEALDRFDATRPFGPWLYRIVVNRSLNARKSRARRSGESIAEELPAGDRSPERVTEAAEVRRRVRAALDRLPERQRLVVQMIELEGFAGPEVAEVLGIPEGTVRWHLHNARKALRAVLGAEQGGSA